jgi:hypothetical protein
MRNVKVLRVYNLLDSKGNKLQLRLGILNSRYDEVCISNADQGYRWSFIGEHIPMPVRSMTWFNGFPEEVMLSWLNGNGWYPQSRVEMDNGRCRVYELPNKGNEMDLLGTDEFPALSEYDKGCFDRAIRMIVGGGHKANAVRVYRYAHGGKLSDALKAVNIIITE